ncbi:hypothetical protein V5O48_006864 [Marasmius crinis-equi]|uniref:Uncharacterized protein n=1 Tax=Marasmius crinis-equi TaxID=585013 RepID=A0ABR3FIC6_9AGAR
MNSSSESENADRVKTETESHMNTVTQTDTGSQSTRESNSDLHNADNDTERSSVLDSSEALEPFGSYLTKVIQRAYWERELRLNCVPTVPNKTAIEHSFDAFTSALGRSLICAQFTPPSRSIPGTQFEFEVCQIKLGVAVDSAIPSTTGEQGNLLEAKRMLLSSSIKWGDLWGSSLPDGLDKTEFYRDLMYKVSSHAKKRLLDDKVLRLLKNEDEVFRYKDADWREIMGQDLRQSKWDHWKNV